MFIERNIDADFRHTRIRPPRSNRHQRGPAHNSLAISGHQPREGEMTCVPTLPGRRGSLKRRLAGGDSLQINRARVIPVRRPHLIKRETHRLPAGRVQSTGFSRSFVRAKEDPIRVATLDSTINVYALTNMTSSCYAAAHIRFNECDSKGVETWKARPA